MINCHKCNYVNLDDTIHCVSCGSQIQLYNNATLMERENKAAMDNFAATYNDAGEKLQSTEETLQERGNRYGEFKNHAVLSQHLQKEILDHHAMVSDSEELMTSYMQEAISMICHKLARIANGDPYYDDNWRDIAGYAELVVKELNRES